MPTPTIDRAVTNKLAEIPVGERGAPDVKHMPCRLKSDGIINAMMHPVGIAVSNPTSEKTRRRLVPGIITETGRWQPWLRAGRSGSLKTCAQPFAQL